MAGVKGKSGGYRIKSGRKSARVEIVQNTIAHRMFSMIAEYLDDIDRQRQENGNLSSEKLREAALFVKDFALRAMPAKIELENQRDDISYLIEAAKHLAELESKE